MGEELGLKRLKKNDKLVEFFIFAILCNNCFFLMFGEDKLLLRMLKLFI